MGLYKSKENSRDLVYIATCEFKKRTKEEISIKKNDKLIIKNRENSEWLLVYNRRTHKEGYVPSRFIAIYDSLESKDWFFPNITRIDAELLLEYLTNSVGTFLVRNSETEPGRWSLSVLNSNIQRGRHVKHFLIVQSNQRYSLVTQSKQTIESFPSIDALVKQYSSTFLASNRIGCKLTKPCRKLFNVPGVYGTWEENRENITLKEKIGEGVTGKVHKAIWRKTYTVAVKTVDNPNDEITKESMLNEALKMKSLKNQHILKLWCVCTSDPILIVTEYMSNGSLMSYLKNDNGRTIRLKAIVNMATQIASGMVYLEKNGYVHCDLAARNILVGEYNKVKIADFGFTQKLNENNEVEIPSTQKIPLKWSAPELLLNIGKKLIFTTKCDVWSFGVLLYEMVTFCNNDLLYKGMKRDELVKYLTEYEYRLPNPNGICTNQYYEIIKKCWNIIPHDRPTFETLKNYFLDYFNSCETQY